MNILQLTTKLSNNILTPSQLAHTKGRGRGVHSKGTPGQNGKGNAKGHGSAMGSFSKNDKCPPPFEVDDISTNLTVLPL